MVQQITKIGRKEENVIIRYEDFMGGEVLKTELVSDQKPTPEFDKAFADLGKYMCGLMEMPAEWTKDHKTLWVSIGLEKDDTGSAERINCVVTLQVKLAKFSAPITINTPVLREKVTGVPGGGNFMPPKMLDLVKDVLANGDEYLNGTRAQHDLLPRPERGSKSAKAGGKKPTAEETAKAQAKHFENA